MKSPMLTEKALDTAADHIWPLDDLSSEGRRDLRRDTGNGICAFLAAQDREALAEVAVQAWLETTPWPTCAFPLDRERARAVIDALLGDA